MRLRSCARAGFLALLLVSALVGPALAAAAPKLGSAQPLDVPIARIIAGLLISTLVALVVVLVLKRRGGGALPFRLPQIKAQNPDRIVVLETRRLSPHADLCRFTSAGKEYLVIVTPSGSNLIREKDADASLSATPGEGPPP